MLGGVCRFSEADEKKRERKTESVHTHICAGGGALEV